MDETLEQRLARLETTNGYLLWGLVACAVAFMLTWGLAGRSDSNGRFDKVIAHELSIVNDDDEQIASLGAQGGLSDAHSEKTAVLNVGAGEWGVTVRGGDDEGLIGVGASSAKVTLHAHDDGAGGSASVATRTVRGTISMVDDVRYKIAGPRLMMFDVEKSRVFALNDPKSGLQSRHMDSETMQDILKLNAEIAKGNVSDAEGWERAAEIWNRIEAKYPR